MSERYVFVSGQRRYVDTDEERRAVSKLLDTSEVVEAIIYSRVSDTECGYILAAGVEEALQSPLVRQLCLRMQAFEILMTDFDDDPAFDELMLYAYTGACNNLLLRVGEFTRLLRERDVQARLMIPKSEVAEYVSRFRHLTGGTP